MKTRSVPSLASSFDPAAAGWAILPDKGFIADVGPIWTRTAEGRRRFGFLAEPRHGNLVGIVQGGMIMTFADRGLGMLAWEVVNAPVVTISYEHQFVGPARIGSFIELEGDVVRATPGLVTSPSGVIGTCQGTWKILSKGRRLDGPSFPT